MRRRAAASVPYLVWLLVVISLVPWRKGVYYEGGADAVVLAKAALQALAFLLAAARVFSVPRRPLGVRSFLLLGLFASLSLTGALQAGSMASSGVLTGRLVLLAVTVGCVLAAERAHQALTSLLVVMGAVGLAIGATGAPAVLDGARLAGTMPEVAPNVLALLLGAPAVAALHVLIRHRPAPGPVIAAVLLVPALIATGSRMGLLAAAAAVTVDLLYVRRPHKALVAVLAATVPALLAVVAFTPVLSALMERAGGGSLMTLNSRTIAWSAVLDAAPGTWKRWIGSGLDVRTVPVQGQYWDSQVLDSSWISALAQAGILGAVVLALLTLAALAGAVRYRGQGAGLVPALLVFVLVRSFLENGLTEAAPAFVLFFLLALMVEPPARDAAAPPPAGSPPAVARPVWTPAAAAAVVPPPAGWRAAPLHPVPASPNRLPTPLSSASLSPGP